MILRTTLQRDMFEYVHLITLMLLGKRLLRILHLSYKNLQLIPANLRAFLFTRYRIC